MMRTKWLAGLGAAVAVSVAGGVASAATFRGLGSLDPENLNSAALAVTDGHVVAGMTRVAGGGSGAFLWDAAGGMRGIGSMLVTGLTSDAGRVVGRTPGSPSRPAYWTEATGVRTLPMFSLGNQSGASAVSSDGRVIVGASGGRWVAGSTNPPPSSRAVRWVDGVVQDLGTLGEGSGPYGVTSFAKDVSADGTVVVGTTDAPRSGSPLPPQVAFRWTEAGGMMSLGDVPGGETLSMGQAVSADGRVIVGTGSGASGNEAFRWTEKAGLVALGRPAGAGNLGVFDVSGDGSVMVGLGAGPSFEWDRAAVWDVARGWRDVKEMLVGEYGLDLTGWTLRGAYGISPDGSAIVGLGVNPAGQQEGWMAVVPGLSVAGGDANADGRIDGDDYALVDRGYERELGGWGNGDFDGDGVVDAADYLLIDAAFGRQGSLSGSLLVEREARFGAGYVAELVAAVPEPGVLGVGGVVVLVAGGRRRR
jgi:uncharacterized membrane protein